MPARFVSIDYDTPLLLPPNLRDWVPVGHLAHFILDVVEQLDLRQVRVNERGTGSEPYPPQMLMALLLYCYATGVFSSRRIEQATLDSVPDAYPRRSSAPARFALFGGRTRPWWRRVSCACWNWPKH